MFRYILQSAASPDPENMVLLFLLGLFPRPILLSWNGSGELQSREGSRLGKQALNGEADEISTKEEF